MTRAVTRAAPRAALVLSASLASLVVTPARADLRADAERLLAAWKSRGAEVELLAPVFLERGRARTIAVVHEPSPAEPSPVEDTGCLTVALLGPRTLELTATIEATAPPAAPLARSVEAALLARHVEDDTRTRSAGGALLFSRCGAARAELRRVSVELGSPRGAVEILVARSSIPLGEIREILPERAAGLIAPRGDPGGPIEPGPLPERIARAERRDRYDGATRVSRTMTRSSPGGAGQLDLELGPGCHRLELMAEVPAIVPRRVTDVDAEARVQEGGRLLARDRADVPDARLDFCLGETTTVELPFAGASGATNVALLHAEWPLSPSLPMRWGARARAGFASALALRHAPDPAGLPVHESLGTGGLTQVPVEVEPGRCYLAAVALIRGEAKAIRFSARVGDRSSHDALERPEGAALAFCAQAESRALFEVDLRGGSSWWVLAVWPLGAARP